MHSDMHENERVKEHHLHLTNLKKTNPQALPPAGKNFYDYQNKNTFISAQKYGSMAISSPSSEVYKRNEKYVIQRIEDTKKRTGKKLFMNNLANTMSVYTPFQFESPFKSGEKANQFEGALSKTLDHRRGSHQNGKSNVFYVVGYYDHQRMNHHEETMGRMSQKPPKNPTRNIPQEENQRQDTHQLQNYHSLEHGGIEKRSSSLSKLGLQNYQQMVRGYESPARDMNSTIDERHLPTYEHQQVFVFYCIT